MSSAVVSPAGTGAIEVLRLQAQAIQRALRMNTEGLTQEDSLVQPQPGGNCMNWVVGHLVWVNNQILPLTGQQPVNGADALKQYERGSQALKDPAAAMPLSELLGAWDEQCSRLDAGLAALPLERLEQPAPFSPRKNPEETVGSLLTILLFHQAYHSGQTGLLRRLVGREGAFK